MIGDTIFAVASPPGPAARGVLRVSGPDAVGVCAGLLRRGLPRRRAAAETSLAVLGFAVPCLVLVMPGPRSYTGEDVVELHLPGGPLLLEKVAARLRRGARDATPGEFTRRAHVNGRLDLAAAEGVIALIHAAGEEERRRALSIVRGGLSEAVDGVRGTVQDALALLESGLDFAEGETGEVEPSMWLPRVAAARERVAALLAQVPETTPGGELLLLGAANAGKSSLCNALAGREVVLVSARSGTTRDVLDVEVAPGVRVLDAPGDVEDAGDLDRAAAALRDRLAARGGGAVLVVDRTRPRVPAATLPVVAAVITKADLPASEPLPPLPPVPVFEVSSVTGAGLAALRGHLARHARAGPSGRSGRAADRLRAARDALGRAVAAASSAVPDELVAVELGDALAALGEVHGRSSPEDLLDRIFSRFCLGK